jgi:hypothetical protein
MIVNAEERGAMAIQISINELLSEFLPESTSLRRPSTFLKNSEFCLSGAD